MEVEKRARQRQQVQWPAWCRGTCGDAVRVTIVDCTEGSFGVVGDHPCSAGDAVQITFDQIGEFSCLVIWKRDSRFGVKIVDDHAVFPITDLLASGILSDRVKSRA